MKPEQFNALYDHSMHNPDVFWEQAAQSIAWRSQWHRVSHVDFLSTPIQIAWFEGATLNVAENCVDRHVAQHGDKIAYYCVPDDATQPISSVTYAELYAQICQAAHAMQAAGIGKGDRVVMYLPMRIEAVVAMLACARIGAIHCVVFAGFSAQALADRIIDAQPKLVITALHGVRGGKHIPLKETTDHAMILANSDAALWCVDVDWQDHVAAQPTHHHAEAFDAEHPLFMLYTSGSTGKPKGLVHSSGGYLVQTLHSFCHVFDVREGDVYWCTADIGWITGHSYLVYAPLAAGATSILFEGIPTYPTPARCWEIIDRLGVTQFYTAPTALRMLMREGDHWLNSTKRDSLRILGSVGEPINPEVWHWYHDHVGNARCAIVDTWWQTETGAHLITAIPHAFPPKAGAAQKPYFTMRPSLLRSDGSECSNGEEGALCFSHSWPAQARSIWGDDARFAQTYFAPFSGYYFTGDAARYDAEGDLWILGRMDDVLNISGHRIGTAEVESALMTHPAVAEVAVVGVPHALKGEAIIAFVHLHEGVVVDDAFDAALKATVRTQIGGIAVPEHIIICTSLPKTRSGKIMRRIVRKIAAGEVRCADDIPLLGDISTLTDPRSVETLIEAMYGA